MVADASQALSRIHVIVEPLSDDGRRIQMARAWLRETKVEVVCLAGLRVVGPMRSKPLSPVPTNRQNGLAFLPTAR